MKLIIKDTELKTEEDIKNRLSSVRKQRDIISDTPCKNNNIETFRKKNARIAKLTEREGKLCLMLRGLK